MKQQRKKNAPAARAKDPEPRSLRPKVPGSPWTVTFICLFLVAIVFVVYGQTVYFGFVNYDDGPYVYANPTVSAGLTLDGIVSAFSHYQLSNWVPLTMISHMLDCQFYHLDPAGHHLTNVLLHTATAIILFLVLRQMTGALWRSAFAAAVFAVHPLHVESVAWVAERKDVLSGLFFVLTLWAYVRYCRKPGSRFNYLMVMFWFALGLMSKPMLMTVPLVLLLLDYWPLNRFTTTPPIQLIAEKIPMLGLSMACGLLTVFAQGQAIQTLTEYPFPVRVENAVVTCVIYAGQMFYPANLTAFYPYPVRGYPLTEVFGAMILLAVISAATFFWRRKYPYLLAGWWWFLVMLIPVIGVVQVGYQARADRYTYLPEIGLGVMVVWLVAELNNRLRNGRVILGIGGALMLAALIASARIQTTFWSDSEALWSHALACTRDNSIAHNNLGIFLAQKGDLAEATGHFEKAVEIDPRYVEALYNLGNVCYLHGQFDQALVFYQKALEISPDSANIEDSVGLAYVRQGQLDEAIRHFQKSVNIDPGYPDGSNDLHQALTQKGQSAGAAVPESGSASSAAKVPPSQ